MMFWISRSSRFCESLVIEPAIGNFVAVRVRAGQNSVLGAGNLSSYSGRSYRPARVPCSALSCAPGTAIADPSRKAASIVSTASRIGAVAFGCDR